MTIATRKSRLFDPNGTEPVGSGTPALSFASLPDPATVPGQVRIASDVGPAPGIELISNGTIWRPRGGSQVLAMRSINPVTVQDLAGAVAETIGPFPGGLVRAGMRLVLDYVVDFSSNVSTNRVGGIRIGDGATRNAWISPALGGSGSTLVYRGSKLLQILSDTSAAHYGAITTQQSFASGAFLTPTVDFSLDWSADIFLTSAAETPVAITAATWVGGVATYNTSAAHTLAVGDKTVIAGVTPSGYNVAAGAIVLSVPTTTSFTVAIASDPGAYTSGGTSSRISNMVSQSYVLSLIG